MSEAMTQLERELLAYVERLVGCCEVSAKELRGLEQRSTTQQGEMLTGLRDCVGLLIRSQLALTQSLASVLTESATYAQLEEKLTTSEQLLMDAEARLKRR